MTNPDRLAALLAKPDQPVPMTGQEWQTLLSQARRARLHGRLAVAMLGQPGRLGLHQVPVQPADADADTSDEQDWPSGPLVHLAAALKVCQRVEQGMRLEAEKLADVLRFAGHRTLLLKGAAYLCADLPPARGRIFGDIDILVPKDTLRAVEASLMSGGWISSELDAYNQRYYRQWMHEIPPLTHVKRGSTVDVHHTIAPPTSAFQVDGKLLLAAARPVGTDGRFWVLQPVDMVLHSAVHLFADGEFDQGLRDLLDLHDLLGHFATHEPDFWRSLFARARELRLERPLHHALHHVERLFGPVVPAGSRADIDAIAPPRLQRVAMRWLLTLALRPNHPSCDDRFSGLARWLLFVRSHWLRMPVHLLVPHLVRKAWMARFPGGKTSGRAVQGDKSDLASTAEAGR